VSKAVETVDITDVSDEPASSKGIKSCLSYTVICFIWIALSGGTSPLLMAGHRHVTSRIRKGNQNILICNGIILPLLTARVEAFLPWHLPWHALVWRRH